MRFTCPPVGGGLASVLEAPDSSTEGGLALATVRSSPSASDFVATDVTFDTSTPFPDVYGDSIQVGVGPFGVQLTFALTDPEEGSTRQVVARVRVSPQLAYVTVLLLRKALREARNQGIGISVPKDVLEKLQLEEDL